MLYLENIIMKQLLLSFLFLLSFQTLSSQISIEQLTTDMGNRSHKVPAMRFKSFGIGRDGIKNGQYELAFNINTNLNKLGGIFYHISQSSTAKINYNFGLDGDEIIGFGLGLEMGSYYRFWPYLGLMFNYDHSELWGKSIMFRPQISLSSLEYNYKLRGVWFKCDFGYNFYTKDEIGELYGKYSFRLTMNYMMSDHNWWRKMF